MTLAQMAEKLGRTKSSVYGKLGKLRASDPALRPLRPRGSAISWKPNEDDFLRKYFLKWPPRKIARKLKRSLSSIRARRLKLGLVKQLLWSDKDIKKLKRLLPKFSP